MKMYISHFDPNPYLIMESPWPHSLLYVFLEFLMHMQNQRLLCVYVQRHHVYTLFLAFSLNCIS